jgi:putative DNA primase/helicase
MQKYFYLAEDVVNKQVDGIPLITIDNTDYFNNQFGCLPTHYFPYFNPDESFSFYMVRWPHGKKSDSKKETRPYIFDIQRNKWKSKFSANPRTPYNLPELLARLDAVVLIVEGEKSVEAAKLLFPDCVVITSSGGANGSNSTDWSYLKDREIIISPDFDAAGKQYFTRVKNLCVKAEAKSVKQLFTEKLGRFIIDNGVIVERQGEVPAKYDLADSLYDGWSAELINSAVNDRKLFTLLSEEKTEKIIKDNRIFEDEEEVEHPSYKLTKSGILYLLEYKEDGETHQQWTMLCGHLKAVCQIRDVDSNNWGLLFELIDRDHKKKEIVIHRDQLHTDKTAIELLSNKGLKIPRIKKFYKSILTCDLINDYISSCNPSRRAIGIDTVGWHGDSYILPYVDNPKNVYYIQDSYKENEEDYILQSNSAAPRRLIKKGTLKSWQDNVGVLAKDNTVPVFSCAAALAPLLLKPLGEDGCCFHFSGSSSIGKSTALHIAASIWGMTELSSFRSTDNAAESLCKNSNDGLILMDELAQGKVEAIEQIAYLFGNGKGKARANRKGEAKVVSDFKILGISSGEIGLPAKLAEKGKSVTAGMDVRFIDVDADMGKGFGVFDNLHGFKDGDALSKALQKQTKEHSGVVIDEFAKYLTSNFYEVKDKAYSIINDWLSINLPPEADGQVARVARKFALVAAAGEIAIEAKILPFNKFDATLHCAILFRNWLNKRGGAGSQEFKGIVDRLRNLVQEGINSRFLNADGSDENKNIKAAGYKKIGTDGTLDEYWFNPDIFVGEIMQHRDTKVFYPQLIKGGFVVPDTKSHQNGQLRTPAKERRRRFIIVPASKFSEE